MRLGIIRNPMSTGNRHRPAGPTPPGVLLREPERPEALSAMLVELRDAGIGALAIDGGDGTVREVLSRLPEAFGDDVPALAILPNGNTNLFAREIGGWGGRDGLARLADAVERGRARSTPRPVLRVERAGQPPLRGLILGFGAYAEGTRIAEEEIAARGGRQLALAVLATIRRALIGCEAGTLRRGVAVGLTIDGAAAAEGARLLFVATTAQASLAPGLDPFWGEGRGPIRWLDVLAPGRRLALAAPFAAIGRPRRWMARAGYRSGRATRIAFDIAAPFVLDGEPFEIGSDGRATVSGDERFVFLGP